LSYGCGHKCMDDSMPTLNCELVFERVVGLILNSSM